MVDFGGRPLGRLCCWVMMVGLWVGILVAPGISRAGVPAPHGMPAPHPDPQVGATTTTVADTVYMADGTPAAGTLIISWPAFLTSTGTPVAAGNTAVTLSSNGALNVALVSNVGASPAGRVLLGGLSAGTWRGEDGVLAGSGFDYGGESGGGADDSGIGGGDAAGIDAVREFGTGDGGALRRDRDD